MYNSVQQVRIVFMSFLSVSNILDWLKIRTQQPGSLYLFSLNFSIMAQSVQFIGVEETIKAFQNRDVEAWSIWQSNQFMFKGLGLDELKSTLNMLYSNGSQAIYSLRVYEDVKDVKKIKSTTSDDGSFNFRLNRLDYEGGNPGSRESTNNLILSKLTALEAKFEALESEDEEKDNNDDFGMIGRIISHPSIAPAVPAIIQGIVQSFTKNIPPSRQIAGVTNDAELEKVVLELKKHDPDLTLHLNKLLQIAQTNNTLFNQLLTYLQ